MQWLSKKFLIKSLKMYFDIEDQSQIGVQFKLLNIFGKHSVVCQNLKLKPQVVNNNQMIVHVHQCKISRIQIAIDSSKQQLLSAKVSGVNLVLKFNRNVQKTSAAKILQKPQIQQFKRVISSEETYEKINYFESSPFKKMIVEQVLRKTSLQIENVDISLIYSQLPVQKNIGLKIGELNICQRFIINRTKNGENQKDEQMECKLNNFGVYFGMNQNETMVKPSFHKQVIKPNKNSLKKRFLLEKNQLIVYFNDGNNTLSVISQLLELNLSAFYIRELMSLITEVKPLLSKAPKIRPGQGKLITSGAYKFSQGTAEWWKFIGMSLVEKIKQKEQYNIIQNREYRLYLYCLLYCYTYGAEPIYLNFIENSQRYKKAKHVMNSHKFIIEKIYRIQNKELNNLDEMELRGFVSFLSIKPKKKDQRSGFSDFKNTFWQELSKLSAQKELEYSDVKKIKYEDIKKSKVFINFSNCLRFLTEYERQMKNTLSTFFRMKSFQINLVETREQVKMVKQIYKEHPQHFYFVKNEMMRNYFYEHLKSASTEDELLDQKKSTDTVNQKLNTKKDITRETRKEKSQFLPYLTLDVEHICMEIIENRFAFTIGRFKGKQTNQQQKILDIKNLSIVNSALEKYSEREGRIIHVGSQLEFCVLSVFINLTLKTAEKLLMLKTLIDTTEPHIAQESQANDTFLNKFMKKKIVSDMIFNSLQKQSMHFLIKTVTLVTPAFDKDKIFQINLSKLDCDYPAVGTKTISLEKIELKRTTLENMRNRSWKRLGENESIILENDRSFTILISESYKQVMDSDYFQFVKSYSNLGSGKNEQLKKGASMIRYEARSCINLIIPFLFVQLACEDVYYLMIMGKFWKELMCNPYIFRPQFKSTEDLEEATKPQTSSAIIQFIRQIEKNTNLMFQTHITLDGFEFIFNGDSAMNEMEDFTGVNRICTLMIDSINYDVFSGLKEDRTKVQVKNVYLRNMLGNDGFNVEALEEVSKEYMERRQPLIQRKNSECVQNSYLMMYNHYVQDFEDEDKVPFLQVDICNSMNIDKLKGQSDMRVKFKAFEVFHQPKFFRCLMQIMSRLDLISGRHYEQIRGKVFEKSFVRQTNERQFLAESKLLAPRKEILYSRDFSVVHSVQVRLEKVNLIVLLQSDPVYCIALDSITVHHKTESYITVYNISVKQLYIIDVSQTSGPHSMIIESTTPLNVNFTQYNCQLLKERYKRSALMKIEISQAVIHFLNKKIMEFINFINQLKEDVLGKPDKPAKSSKPNERTDYPFCYEIVLLDSRVILYRNSLSKEKFDSRISIISVTNFKGKSTEETIKRKTLSSFNNYRRSDLFPSESFPNKKPYQKNPLSEQFLYSIEDLVNETHYEYMQQISENRFKSFLEESVEQNQRNDFIYIDIFNFSIEGRHRQKDILFIDEMRMSFHDIELKIFIPELDLCIDNDDFRLLIRLTEQNFGEQDRHFRVNPVLRQERIEKFVTMFSIMLTKIECIKGDYGLYEGKNIDNAEKSRNREKEQQMNILNLRDLQGKDVSFINGEKLDEIQILRIQAEDENMVQFIERYERSLSDPIIQVKPQTISHSQQYFTKLSKIFEIFSKLDDEGEQSSDFDYKEEEVLKIPKRGEKIITVSNEQQRSNCEKLMKWLSGMCDKCFWWVKGDREEVNSYNVAKTLLNREAERRKKLRGDMIQEHTIFCNGDYNISHIFNDKQMIRLENKVSPETFFPLYDVKYPNQVYFRMDMETTKQKKMYILAKELAMTYESNKGLLELSSFFAKPYSPFKDNDPPFVDSNFNNFRPAQIYMEVKDSCLEMKKDFVKLDSKNFKKIESTQKILVFLDLIYNMENMGDMVKGPGKSVKEANVVLQAFHSIVKEGNTQFIELSNLIELIYRNEANVSYKKTERTKFEEKIIIKPYFDRQKSVSFFIPAFSIKSLIEIYKQNFKPGSKPTKFQSRQNLEKVKMDRMTSGKSTHYLEDTHRPQKSSQIASKIDQKKQKIQQKDVQSSITKRAIYMKSLCINLESKLQTSFVKIFVNDMIFSNLYSNLVMTEKSKMQLTSELAIDYWNLHLLEFEPFLEAWNSKLIMKTLKRKETLSKKIRLQSFNKAIDIHNVKNHHNWLNLNLSTAFFHTFKELELKYHQGKDEKQESCLDITFRELPDLLKLDFKQCQAAVSRAFNKFTRKENFPQAMRNFFGRRFIVEMEAIRKKGFDMRERYFHEYGTVYNLYHSYFNHEKRKKNICYRTPFRILNCYSDKMIIRFKVRHRSSTFENPKFIDWKYSLSKGDYLALPALIYKLDFLICFEHSHGNMTSVMKRADVVFDDKLLAYEDQRPENQIDEDSFMSAQYLMQLHSQRIEFHKNKNSKILKKLFSEDSKKDRFLDSRDILIKSGKHIFALICTKSEYENDKQKSKTQFYDTVLAIVAPIEIYNYCPIPLTVILNGKKQYILPSNKSTFINQDLNFRNIHETVIEFREHVLHREFTFLKKENDNHTYFMEIDRMQSVNVRVIKETTSTFSIEIYADWIVENHTEEEFELDHITKLFPVDRHSSSSLAIENYQHGRKIQLQLSIYSVDDTHHYPYNIVTNGTETTEIVTLYKRVPDSEEKRKLMDKKNKLKITSYCCLKGFPFNEETKEKKSDQIFKVYSFVLKIGQYQNCKFTKTLSIRYKIKMKNKTNKILLLYQYTSQFLIEKLYPDNEVCIWGYDFLPEYYLIEKRSMDTETNNNFEEGEEEGSTRQVQHRTLSDPFRFDQSMGKMMTIKFKENLRGSSNDGEYYKKFSYLKMEINQYDHSSSYDFTEVNVNSSDEFPIYIHNTTDETIKIYENGESFLVRPKSKVPFSWSNLVDNSHEIDVEIGDVKKTYSFKQNQEFEPIVIKDENAVRPSLQEPKTNFHKEICRVKYGLVEGKFETIIDIKENCLIILPGLEGIQYKFDMKRAVKMTTSAQSIELNLGPKQQPLTLFPSNETFETWLSYLNFTINQDIISQVSFTIETYKNSRLFFFHNVELGRENDYLTSSENYFVENLFVSVVNQKPEEVILLHLGDIRLTKQDRVCRLGYDDYQIQKCDRKIQIKEVKVNNQLLNAVNPVILTQIKKSKTPFISIITRKRNLVKSKDDLEAFQFKDELITHFESFRFFLDEAEAMVEASLIPKLLSLKNQMERVQTQYHIDDCKQKQHTINDRPQVSSLSPSQQTLPADSSPEPQSYQLYLSFLEIRPIKMTVSVSFDKLSKDQQEQRMNMEMLNMLPVGIENAIITIDSYMFHHIYEDKEQVMKQIQEFYKSELTKQVLINAGNLEFLVAIDLIKNLGIGVKNIFYDPIYEFASNKDIKNTTSTLLQGIFSLVLLIISFFVKICNLVFKILAICTFDTDYKARREIFRKQIFKSPLDGAVFGGKYFWKIFKSIKEDFFRLPISYYQDYSLLGCVWGFMLAILNVIPWLLKVFITTYDMFYVIGIGFVSWGHYQQNAMRNRSRPIRVFHKKKLVGYNLLEAKAHEIMRKHNIMLTEKQSVLYVRDVDNLEKTTSYLILSDYSLLYCDNRLSIFDQIVLYKVLQFKVVYPQQKKGRKSVYLEIALKSPNSRKFFFIEFTQHTYNIKFKCYQELLELLDKLQELKQKSQQSSRGTQKYNYVIVDERKGFNKEQGVNMWKQSQPLEYKDMEYLVEGKNQSQNVMIDSHELQFINQRKNGL